MIVFGFKKHEICLKPWNFFLFFSKIYRENGWSRSQSRNFWQAGAGAEIFDKLEPESEPHKMDRLRNTGQNTIEH
jgi:hypothetical protein